MFYCTFKCTWSAKAKRFVSPSATDICHLENTVLTADRHCASFNCIFYPVVHIVMEIQLKVFNGYLGNAGLILCVSEQICCLDRK